MAGTHQNYITEIKMICEYGRLKAGKTIQGTFNKLILFVDHKEATQCLLKIF